MANNKTGEKKKVEMIPHDTVQENLDQRDVAKATEVKTDQAERVRDERELMDQLKKTKEYLLNQPKVRFIIPLQGKEKAGKAEEFVSINGVSMYIKKGVPVDLPQDVAKILEDHYGYRSETAEEFDIENREDKRNALIFG